MSAAMIQERRGTRTESELRQELRLLVGTRNNLKAELIEHHDARARCTAFDAMRATESRIAMLRWMLNETDSYFQEMI